MFSGRPHHQANARAYLATAEGIGAHLCESNDLAARGMDGLRLGLTAHDQVRLIPNNPFPYAIPNTVNMKTCAP